MAEAAYDWYQAFYERKVLPGLLREMRPCSGCLERADHADFFSWLQETDRPLYDEITLQDEKILAIWKSHGDKARFKEACRAWVLAHMRAKPKYLAAMTAGPVQERLL